MDHRGENPVIFHSTMQRLKDRARSVDRYGAERRSFVGGVPVTTLARPGAKPPTSPDTDFTRHRLRLPMSQPKNHRGRSPSLNNRILQNLQSFVGYLFERKNDEKKRRMAENLLWTAARRNEVNIFCDILSKLMDPDYDVNRVNEFGWRMVDEAIMLGNCEMAQELFKRGGKETEALRESKQNRQACLKKALRRLEALQAPSRLTDNADIHELNLDLAAGTTLALVNQMMQNVEKTRPPRNYLDKVSVEPCGDCNIALAFTIRTVAPGVVSRYKIEWAADPLFSSTVDYEVFFDVMAPERLIIEELDTNLECYFRLSVANLAGFGMPVNATPFPCILSSWRDVSGLPRRFTTAVTPDLKSIWNSALSLETQLRSKSWEAPESRAGKNLRSSRSVHRRPSLKESLRSIIKPHSRSTSVVRDEGIFLSCLCVHEDSVLLTTDYALPTAVIQTPFLGTVTSKEYLWLRKLASSWDITGSLHALLHRAKDTAVDLRYSILTAATTLQENLDVKDLGVPYFRYITDKASSRTYLLLVKQVSSAEKARVGLGLRWTFVKEAELLTIGPCNSVLSAISTVGFQELLVWFRAVRQPLRSGLHIAYIELSLTEDNVAAVVTKKCPNMLPSVKIRQNGHISREEWILLTSQNSHRSTRSTSVISLAQKSWEYLSTHLSLRNVEAPKVFDEVIELGPETSVLVVYSDKRGVAARQSLDDERRRGSLLIPVQILEAEILETYRREAWQLYCRCSLLLESIVSHLQCQHRENWDNEGNDIKAQMLRVQLLQTKLEQTWNDTRWLPKLVRTITSRTEKGLLLYPQGPPVKPPRNGKQNGTKNGETGSHAVTKTNKDFTVTISIVPPSKEIVHPKLMWSEVANEEDSQAKDEEPRHRTRKVTVETLTTATNVIHDILAPYLGTLTASTAKNYRLQAAIDEERILLAESTNIKQFLQDFPDAKLYLIPLS